MCCCAGVLDAGCMVGSVCLMFLRVSPSQVFLRSWKKLDGRGPLASFIFRIEIGVVVCARWGRVALFRALLLSGLDWTLEF